MVGGINYKCIIYMSELIEKYELKFT